MFSQKFFLLLFSLAIVLPLAAQEPALETEPEAEDAAEEEIILLPEVEVSAEKENVNRVTQEQMEREGSGDLWEALRNVPGVIRSGGGGEENEGGFRVRGFDSSRMPVFIDEVPFESPYRGNSDFSRLLTADLESVVIEKGYSSMLLGANTMGGAILLRTAKPEAPFELAYKSSFDFDSAMSYSGSLNTLAAGTRQNLFYAKTVFQFRPIDYWRLSGGFTPYYANPQQGGERLNSDSSDIKITALGGWTPSENFSLNVSYTLLDADKGLSPPEVNKTSAVSYEWPLWKRHTAKLDGQFKGLFAEKDVYVKGFFFFDKFDTELIQSAAWTLDMRNDDYILGSHLEGGIEWNSWSALRAAFNFKREAHKRGDNGEAAMDIAENTVSGGAEFQVSPFLFFNRRPLTFSAGAGFDLLIPETFWALDRSLTQTALRYMFSWQAGVFFDITQNHTVRFTYAKKNHIPSMWQRYENIFEDTWDDSIPNPNLKNETASHFEFGYRGFIRHDFNAVFKPALSIDTAVYFALLNDMIAEGDITTSTGGTTKMRVNIDRTAYYGFEAGLSVYLCEYLSLGGVLSFNRYRLLSGASGYQIEGNFPRTTGSLYLTITPLASFSPLSLRTLTISPVFEYEGPRYSRFTRLGTGALIPRYAIFSLKLSSELNENFSLSAGIENLFDADYYLDSAYLPMPGRVFNFTFTAEY
jgi:iron complex outermembrane receptor protein